MGFAFRVRSYSLGAKNMCSVSHLQSERAEPAELTTCRLARMRRTPSEHINTDDRREA